MVTTLWSSNRRWFDPSKTRKGQSGHSLKKIAKKGAHKSAYRSQEMTNSGSCVGFPSVTRDRFYRPHVIPVANQSAVAAAWGLARPDEMQQCPDTGSRIEGHALILRE